MTYHRPIQIEFNPCDPAGIVFFPRYYEMVSSVFENFHKAIAGRSYARMMAARQGVPTVRMTQAFVQGLKAVSWPPEMRARIEAFRTAQTP